MSSKGNKSQARRGRASAKDVDLRAVVAERERQLRELTEQSLGFLEQLAESRRVEAEQARLAARIADLERSLEDAKQRLRHAGGSAPGADGNATTASLEVVFWGEGTAATAIAAAGKLGVPVTWVGQPADVPANARKAKDLFWISHRDARTPAQCWNLGMASTRADAVLFLGPAARIEGALHAPAGAAKPNVALLCPRIRRGRQTSVGLEELDGLLHLRPLPVVEGRPLLEDIPFPSIQAFVVRRAAFERIGMFHEGLLGATSMLDFALRARAANFAVQAALDIAVQAAADHPGSDGTEDRERLQLIATYRPALIGRALADSAELWKLEPAALAPFLRQLLARLPCESGADAMHELLAQVASAMVEHSLPAQRIIGQVRTIRLDLLQALPQHLLTEERAQVTAAILRAESEPCASVTAAFAALAQDLDLERLARAELVRQLESVRADRDQKAIAADKAASDGHAVHSELVESNAKLAKVEQRLEWTGQMLANVQAQLDQSRNDRATAEQKLAATAQQLTDIRLAHTQSEQELEGHRSRLEEALRQLGANQQEARILARNLASEQKARSETESSMAVALQALEEATKTLARTQARLTESETELAAVRADAIKLDARLMDAHREIGDRQRLFEDADRKLDATQRRLEDSDRKLDATQRERDVAVESLASAQDQLRHARGHVARLEQELHATKNHRDELADRSQHLQHIIDLTQVDLRNTQTMYQETMAELDRTRESLRAAHGQVAALARCLGFAEPPPPDRLEHLTALVRRDAERLGELVAGAKLANSDALADELQRGREAQAVLREREAWIATLLGEVTKRRLKRRPLLPHEREFLARRKP